MKKGNVGFDDFRKIDSSKSIFRFYGLRCYKFKEALYKTKPPSDDFDIYIIGTLPKDKVMRTKTKFEIFCGFKHIMDNAYTAHKFINFGKSDSGEAMLMLNYFIVKFLVAKLNMKIENDGQVFS